MTTVEVNGYTQDEEMALDDAVHGVGTNSEDDGRDGVMSLSEIRKERDRLDGMLRVKFDSLTSQISALTAERNEVLRDLKGVAVPAPAPAPTIHAPRTTRRARMAARTAAKAAAKPSRTKTGERLPRRSTADIEARMSDIAKALKSGPMRAEEIRKTLGIDKRELPRILKTGLAKKVWKASGHKRSTAYSLTK